MVVFISKSSCIRPSFFVRPIFYLILTNLQSVPSISDMTHALRALSPLKQGKGIAFRIPAVSRTFSPCIRQLSTQHTASAHSLKRLQPAREVLKLPLRTYTSSTSDTEGACELSFDLVEPEVKDQQLQGQTLVICHGLL